MASKSKCLRTNLRLRTLASGSDQNTEANTKMDTILDTKRVLTNSEE
jgi:hypothetical protein